MDGRPSLKKGDEIMTNYSGPYTVAGLIGPCTCPAYLTTTESPPHWHIECEKAGDDKRRYWLNGYVEEAAEDILGTTWIHCVWSGDWLWKTGRTVVPEHEAKQMELFA